MDGAAEPMPIGLWAVTLDSDFTSSDRSSIVKARLKD
jgi:hypothetical protein